MKRSILIFIVTLLTIAFFSQNTKAQCPVSLSELEKTCSYSSSDLETFALKNKFSRWKNSDQNGFITSIYMCDSPRPNGRKDQISRTSGNGVQVIIAYSTSDKQYYLDLKTRLSSIGYKQTKEEQQKVGDALTTWYYYSSGKYDVIIYSYDVQGVTIYECHVSNKV